MTRERWRPLLSLALGALLTWVLPACYDVPKPQCGFRCGPDGACPEDYTCNPTDGRCHLDGAPASLVCATDDAGVDGDAGVDATIDATLTAPVTGAQGGTGPVIP
jgi:hypothetical protein